MIYENNEYYIFAKWELMLRSTALNPCHLSLASICTEVKAMIAHGNGATTNKQSERTLLVSSLTFRQVTISADVLFFRCAHASGRQTLTMSTPSSSARTTASIFRFVISWHGFSFFLVYTIKSGLRQGQSVDPQYEKRSRQPDSGIKAKMRGLAISVSRRF
jgi:hypothetical protein